MRINTHKDLPVGVQDSEADTLVQSTIYYASGVPMEQSFGRDKQPYLYNGKEFVEAHEWNTYDYGFRGYYATIGRFTCVDPLAEQTPWLSPYAYAGNNFINAIDWMGLSGFTPSTMHWVAVDENYIVLDFDLNSSDQGVYMVDDENWDGTYWDLLRYAVIGQQKNYFKYKKGNVIGNGYNTSGGGYYNKSWGCWVKYGTIPRQDADMLVRIFRSDNSALRDALEEFAWNIFSETNTNYFYEANLQKGEIRKFMSSKLASRMKFALDGTRYISWGLIIYRMIKEGPNSQNLSNAVELALTNYLVEVAMERGFSGLVAALGKGAAFIGGIGFLAGESYLLRKGIANITNSINTRAGNLNFYLEMYVEGY